MNVLLLSFWRNDSDRDLQARMRHLRSKAGICKWVWIVGDSADNTEAQLRKFAMSQSGVDVIRFDTGILGEDIDTRRRRISATETLAYAALGDYEAMDYVIQHESDLQTRPDVVSALLRLANANTAVAGWPTLALNGRTLFYDIWAYRGLDGIPFDAIVPYHTSYRSQDAFEVSSFGSVWMAPWSWWPGRVIERDCVVELCRQWREIGRQLLVDPTIPVSQPIGLWEAQ